MKASNQSFLKINNQKVILDYILSNGATSRAELSKNLGVSKPTVSTNVAYLIDNNILIEEGFYNPTVGKKAVLLHFNKNRNYVLVCDFISDILNKNIIISICNLNYEEVLTQKLEVDTNLTLENLDYILNYEIVKLLNTNKIPLDMISTVVLATPGIVSNNKLSFKKDTGDIFDISEICNKNFKDKVILKNDIKLATIAEKHFGLGSDYENICFIWSGIAISSGLILDNKLYNGKNFSAGELGLLLANSPFTKDNCLLSEICSITGLLDSIKKYNNIPKESILFSRNANLTFDDIVSGIYSKDSYCIKIVKSIGREFGKVLYNLSLSIDLEIIILSGEFFKLGEIFLNEINNILRSNPINKINLQLSKLSNPIILGGYKFGVEDAINKLIQ